MEVSVSEVEEVVKVELVWVSDVCRFARGLGMRKRRSGGGALTEVSVSLVLDDWVVVLEVAVVVCEREVCEGSI